MNFLSARTQTCSTLVLSCVALLALDTRGSSQTARTDTLSASIAEHNPADRVQALEHFVLSHPESSRLPAAENALLDTYLASFPGRTEQIHGVATALCNAAAPGIERWLEQVRLAALLADTGEHGADLADADTWAQSAVASIAEPAYGKALLQARLRYHLPSLSAQQARDQFAQDRAAALTALAGVRLAQNDPKAAKPLLAKASVLAPHSSTVVRLLGELAFVEGDLPRALDDLVRADALNPLPPLWRQREVLLFQQLHHGSADDLELRTDEAYRSALPAPFHLTPRHLPAGGHPVLLELFTGSDCLPCAGPDLALDSLLGSYDRIDLIALEYDIHVPYPDPLTTVASLQRSAFYEIEATPTAFLDGAPLQILGSSRKGVENIVVGFADQIEAVAANAPPLQLSVDPSWTTPEELRLQPTIRLSTARQAGELQSESYLPLRTLQRATLNVALVQDDLRYQGKNGVRFHRMVVRALHQVPAAACLANMSQVTLNFDLAALQAEQTAYLHDFETHNTVFGPVHFRQTDFPFAGAKLAVVAWVQDPLTKRILQSTFAPLPAR